MRRASWVALGAAVLALMVGLTSGLGLLDATAPEPTPDHVDRMLNEARSAIERHDLNGFLGQFVEDARIIGRSPIQVRVLLARVLPRSGIESPIASWDRPVVRRDGKSAVVTVNVHLTQYSGAALTSEVPMTVTLRATRESRWLGLAHAEVWRIAAVETPFDFLAGATE